MTGAALLDLNGTVVDDMRVHAALWRELALQLGHDVQEEQFLRRWAGYKAAEIIPLITGRPMPEDEVRALAARKEQRYREVYAGHVREVPGAIAFVRRLRAAGVKVALATAAPAPNRALALEGLGLVGAFDAVVGAEAVRNGKPAPDIFLAAAAAVGVEPARCVVFEDALNGVEAAHRAGMKAVGVATVHPREELERAGAEWVVDDFRDLPEDLLAALGLGDQGSGR